MAVCATTSATKYSHGGESVAELVVRVKKSDTYQEWRMKMKMRIRIGKRRKIQFTDKKHPFIGIVSMLIAFASLIFIAALFIGSGM